MFAALSRCSRSAAILFSSLFVGEVSVDFQTNLPDLSFVGEVLVDHFHFQTNLPDLSFVGEVLVDFLEIGKSEWEVLAENMEKEKEEKKEKERQALEREIGKNAVELEEGAAGAATQKK